MSEVNINSDEYNVSDVVIFNDGNSGIVENVVITKIEKRPATDPTHLPDWKVFYKSENGGEIGEGIFYPDLTDEKRTKNLFKKIRHLSHCVLGVSHPYPTFPDENSAVDGILSAVAGKVAGKKFRVLATFGTTMGPKNFVQIRSYPPFIELMNVPLADTKLKPSSIDSMVRLTPDVPGGSAAGSNSTTEKAY